MLVLLRKLWFVSVFLILASLSLGALFGYRFSLQEKTIQQRGVLFIEGEESDVAMILDDKTSLVTLPYLDSNIDIGEHTVKLLKAGFHPITVQFPSSKEKAVHLKVEFTPVESRITSTSFTSSKDLKHFFVNDHIFLEYYTDTRVLSFFEKAPSLKLHKPEKVFTLDFLAENEIVEKFNSFKDTKVLLKTNLHWRICTLDTMSCTLIDTDVQDNVFTEQKSLLVFKKDKRELWSIQEQNGELSSPLSKNIKEITASTLLQKSSLSNYGYIFTSAAGSGNILKQDFFGNLRLSELTTGTLPIKALQFKSDDSLLLTSTGALISEKTKSVIESEVQAIYPQPKGTFIIKSLGDILLSSSTAKEFLTRFSSQPKAIFTVENALYGFVVFDNEILHCEQFHLQYCTHLLNLEKFDTVYYSQKEEFFVLINTSNPDSILYTIYFLPTEDTLT
ncbi:MAG: hypothetical protein ACK4NC_01015 [Candidatus Gracilibacteria bacterium]